MWCFTSVVHGRFPLTLVCVFLLLSVGSRAARWDSLLSNLLLSRTYARGRIASDKIWIEREGWTTAQERLCLSTSGGLDNRYLRMFERLIHHPTVLSFNCISHCRYIMLCRVASETSDWRLVFRKGNLRRRNMWLVATCWAAWQCSDHWRGHLGNKGQIVTAPLDIVWILDICSQWVFLTKYRL